eukprot:CAMPEP_0174761944 /NCGR_PEP_ID=MMETSP1094-20130205/109528_1 /TAXON_ID=156173 /ORGANISM="Chrysochromulina brevifilum, Strain UTEX LB 985" /LENGTH=110 /DNA_ID=CAMNT_0015967891 /DNA_START=212 /DNA_END=544 /DNA_ORIENTATION=+
MGAGGRQLTALDKGWAASPVTPEGRAVAAAANTANELPSKWRASEHEACSHTGACKGCIDRRVSRTSPSSRLAQLAEAMLEVLDAMTRAVCGFALRPPCIDVLLGKGAQV